MGFNFSVKKFYGPETALGAAGGATPWGAIAQAGIGLGQMIAGSIQAAKGRKELEKQIAGMPKYQESKGILDYYNQALGRYGVSPTESALYKRQMQNIQRAGAMGLAGAGGARGRMGAASSIVRQMSDASLGAEAAAEQQRAQRFGQLGQAAQLKRGEEAAAFQQNLVAPSQMRLQMAAQRAAGGSQIANIGLSNLFGAGTSLATQDIYGKIYGGEDYRKNLAQAQANRLARIAARKSGG